MTAQVESPAFPHWSAGKPGLGQLDHIPGEPGPAGVGNTLRLLRDPIEYSREMFRDYGPVFCTRIFGDWNVSLLGADANELVLRNKDQVFSNKQGWGPVLDQLFPGGLMLIDGDEHRIDRRALAVAFAKGPLEQYSHALGEGMSREIHSWAVSTFRSPLGIRHAGRCIQYRSQRTTSRLS